MLTKSREPQRLHIARIALRRRSLPQRSIARRISIRLDWLQSAAPGRTSGRKHRNRSRVEPCSYCCSSVFDPIAASPRPEPMRTRRWRRACEDQAGRPLFKNKRGAFQASARRAAGEECKLGLKMSLGACRFSSAAARFGLDKLAPGAREQTPRR